MVLLRLEVPKASQGVLRVVFHRLQVRLGVVSIVKVMLGLGKVLLDGVASIVSVEAARDSTIPQQFGVDLCLVLYRAESDMSCSEREKGN